MLHIDDAANTPLRVLLLGGTSEAYAIADHLADRTDVVTISSLAGRVTQSKLPQGLVRIGGFGGVSGLIAYLESERINVLIDATHPFAANISRNAEAACAQLALPMIAFARQPWTKLPEDRWQPVPDMQSAASFVAARRCRIFLAIGRQELKTFAACSESFFLVRAIESPQDALPPNTKILLQRGPFDLQHEMQLLHDYAIDFVVSKNSGGPATYAKIEASRAASIPVVMVDRPIKHTVPTVYAVEEVLAALDRLLERFEIKEQR